MYVAVVVMLDHSEPREFTDSEATIPTTESTANKGKGMMQWQK